MLQHVAVYCCLFLDDDAYTIFFEMMKSKVGAVCYSVLQYVAVCCSVQQCVAVCCSVLQCAVVCCSVLQCAAVRFLFRIQGLCGRESAQEIFSGLVQEDFEWD